MENLVSVIVPVYKVEKYIYRCIESIINQTYIKLEVILVDDGSPDKCGEICDYYAKKDDRVKVIHKENGGLSDARNKGIDYASGEYIIFIDADDFIHPRMIEILFETIETEKSDVAVCDFLKVYDNEDITFRNIGEYSKNLYTNIEALENFYNSSKIQMLVAWNKLYKIDLFSNIRYPNGKIHEDEFTTYKVLYLANKIVYVDEKLYYYLQRAGSIMSENFNLKRLQRLDALEEKMLFFEEKNLTNLYNQAMFIYLLSICDSIIKLKNIYPKEKEIIQSLKKRYALNYQRAKTREFSLVKKSLLFILYFNKGFYKLFIILQQLLF